MSRVLDLIRIGAYTGMEGNLRIRKSDYLFRFKINQIEDMPELISRVTGRPLSHESISFRSKGLYKELKALGFEKFKATDWNVPKLESFSEIGRDEYLRAVIDSLGNVDVEGNVPVIRLSSHNVTGLSTVAYLFGANSTGDLQQRYRAYWKGKNAIEILDKLEWRFNNQRNHRGADLIRMVRWEEYI